MAKQKSIGREAYAHIKTRLDKLQKDTHAIHSEESALCNEIVRIREQLLVFERIFSEGPWELHAATASGELWLSSNLANFPTLHKDPIFRDLDSFNLGVIELPGDARFHEHDSEMTIQGPADDILKVITRYGIRVDASRAEANIKTFRNTADILEQILKEVQAAEKRAREREKKEEAKCRSTRRNRRRSRSTRTK
jgi:hypothetical protein